MGKYDSPPPILGQGSMRKAAPIAPRSAKWLLENCPLKPKFICNVLSRITLPGSVFLACVAILPAFAGIFGVTQQFAQFFGGTSLLIMVGVILDTLQQIESHLLMRHYDGLMKSGRIKGRSNLNMAI